MLFAIIPAAGHSTRMGRPKLALPLGDRTVLEHTVAALLAGGAERVLVVVGPHVPELVPLAERAGASVLSLPEGTPDMRATVERGLDWAEANWHPAAADAWLLVPADHPVLVPDVIGRLREESAAAPECSIFIPTYQGKRGHPALVGWKHTPGIRSLPAGLGLNAYLRGQAHETREVPVGTDTVLTDLDTPEDYERLLRGWT